MLYLAERSSIGQPYYLIPVLPPALQNHFTFPADEETLMAQVH